MIVAQATGGAKKAAGSISSGSAGTLTHEKPGVVTVSTAGTITQGKGGSVVSKQQAEQTTTSTTPAQTTTTPAQTTTPAKTTTPPAKTTTTPPSTTTTRTGTHKTTTGGHTKQPTRTKTTVRTVTKTRTVIKTVTKTVNPDVPAGAFLPSKRVLAQAIFTVAGSNVTCQIFTGSIRCEIIRRVWAAPVQPATCRGVWGDTISLQQQGLPQFICSYKNTPTNAFVVPVGYDDKVGNFTCQVRSFGVNCFSSSRSGFLISRTGYQFY